MIVIMIVDNNNNNDNNKNDDNKNDDNDDDNDDDDQLMTLHTNNKPIFNYLFEICIIFHHSFINYINTLSNLKYSMTVL